MPASIDSLLSCLIEGGQRHSTRDRDRLGCGHDLRFCSFIVAHIFGRGSGLDHRSPLRASPGHAPLSTIRELTPFYGITLAALTDRGPSPLTKADLKRTGEKEQGAWAHAVKNAAHLLGGLQPGNQLVVHESEHGAAGSIIPLLAGLKKMGLETALVVILPTSKHLLIAMEDDLPTLREMLAKARELWRSGDWCSLSPLRIHDTIEDWDPPPDHPLAREVQAMRSMTNARTVDVECAIAGVLGQAPIAHMGVEAPEDGGRLVASWARGSSVILSENMDAVRLLDTDDAELHDLVVDLDLLLESDPSAFEQLGDSENPTHGLWRTRAPAFPSVRMRGFLSRRAAWRAKGGNTEPREVDAEKLLMQWDFGEPIRVEALPDSTVQLTSPDYRTATVGWEEVKARVEALEPQDQADFHIGRIAVLLLAAMTDNKTLGEMEKVGALVADLRNKSLEGRRQVVSAEASEPATETAKEDITSVSGLFMNRPTVLFPVLRPVGYDAAWEQQARGLAGDLAKTHAIHMPTAIRRPFQHGISVDLVADTPDTMVALDHGQLSEALHDAYWDTALLNLRAASVGAMEELGEGAFRANWRDGYQASRLLVPATFKQAKVKGKHLVFVPSINHAWVTGDNDTAGMTRVLDAIDAWLKTEDANHAYQWRTLMSALPWVIHDDSKVEPWQVPAGHPLADRIAAMEATLVRRRIETAGGAHARGAQTPLRPA